MLLLVAAAGCGGQPAAMTGREPAATEQASPAVPTAPATEAADPSKFVPPIRGLAEIEVTEPVPTRTGNEVVTTIKVKNTSTTSAIAGLRVDEHWYNRAGAPVTGDTFRHPRPLQPGEIVEVTLRTPVNPTMDRNRYQFVHANGNIKTTMVPKL